ncbi:MAG: glutaredoxin domain-containing protein [Proteiniphilum sp.]
MIQVDSHTDFINRASGSERYFLLLYKSGNEQSECALHNLGDAMAGENGVPLFLADVSRVRDIHVRYGISSAPALLLFEEEGLVSVIKGCESISYYRALTGKALFMAKAKAEGKTIKRVTVYSTPTCSWCNTLKGWLRRNNIPFTDVDVSRDEHAAQDLVRRTGQQGVPQTDINGQVVVGFNEQRLKELLEI